MNYHFSPKMNSVIDTIIQKGVIDATSQNKGLIYGDCVMKLSNKTDFVEVNIQEDKLNVYNPEAYHYLSCLNRKNSHVPESFA